MPTGGPALIATDLCTDLACGYRAAVDFFRDPPVEIRLSTITYLHLLAGARSAAEQRRIKRFVAPYPVLSLGPMASAKAVELVLESDLAAGLGPLEALMAATALAHEIPVYTRDPVFRSVPGLEVVTPY